MEFSHDLALALVRSSEEFPVDFDAAWQWIGYAKKQNAKDKLVRNFENGIDYQITQMRESAPRGGLTHREEIAITIDCFKSLGMMAGTAKGKEIRRYFLDCERQLKDQRLPESQPSGIDGIKTRISSLWAECENAQEVAKISRMSALQLARVCGETAHRRSHPQNHHRRPGSLSNERSAWSSACRNRRIHLTIRSNPMTTAQTNPQFQLFQQIKLEKKTATIIGVEYVEPIRAIIRSYGNYGWNYKLSLTYGKTLEDLAQCGWCCGDDDTTIEYWEKELVAAIQEAKR